MTEDKVQTVQMLDEETGEELSMQVYPYTQFDMDGRTYVVLTPHESVVKVLKEVPDEEDADAFALEEIDPEDYEPIEKFVSEALKPWNCQVVIRANEFLLEGDPPEEFFDHDDMEEPIEVETEDGQEDVYIVLQRIDTGSEQFLVVMPESPDLHPAELRADGIARRLSDDELEKLHEMFETKLREAEDRLEAEENEGV